MMARHRRAPVSLDVGDHFLVAMKMSARISMIRVREVATKHRPLPPVHELTNAIGPAKHASVGVNAHDDDVLDLAFLEERQQLPPSSVTASVDEISMHSI